MKYAYFVKRTRCEIDDFSIVFSAKTVSWTSFTLRFYLLCGDFLQVIHWQFSRWLRLKIASRRVDREGQGARVHQSSFGPGARGWLSPALHVGISPGIFLLFCMAVCDYASLVTLIQPIQNATFFGKNVPKIIFAIMGGSKYFSDLFRPQFSEHVAQFQHYGPPSRKAGPPFKLTFFFDWVLPGF
jgi:hypothetical protein